MQSGNSNSGTFLIDNNFLSLIFSVLIGTTRALPALQSILYILSVFFIGLRQTVYNFLPIFLIDHFSFYNSRVFRSNASLMVAYIFPKTYFFTVYSKFPFFSASIFLFSSPLSCCFFSYSIYFFILFYVCVSKYQVEINWYIFNCYINNVLHNYLHNLRCGALVELFQSIKSSLTIYKNPEF